jgi:hypothetical protein
MKKLVVLDEETNSSKKDLVAEFLSMQFNYGLYDFNAEKILGDLEELYGIKLVSTFIPYYNLEDDVGGSIKVMFTEEYD